MVDRRRPNGDGGYHGQIDDFAVYSPQNSMMYLVPIADVTCTTVGRLRIAPPRNGQTRGVRWARYYELRA